MKSFVLVFQYLILSSVLILSSHSNNRNSLEASPKKQWQGNNVEDLTAKAVIQKKPILVQRPSKTQPKTGSHPQKTTVTEDRNTQALEDSPLEARNEVQEDPTTSLDQLELRTTEVKSNPDQAVSDYKVHPLDSPTEEDEVRHERSGDAEEAGAGIKNDDIAVVGDTEGAKSSTTVEIQRGIDDQDLTTSMKAEPVDLVDTDTGESSGNDMMNKVDEDRVTQTVVITEDKANDATGDNRVETLGNGNVQEVEIETSGQESHENGRETREALEGTETAYKEIPAFNAQPTEEGVQRPVDITARENINEDARESHGKDSVMKQQSSASDRDKESHTENPLAQIRESVSESMKWLKESITAAFETSELKYLYDEFVGIVAFVSIGGVFFGMYGVIGMLPKVGMDFYFGFTEVARVKIRVIVLLGMMLMGMVLKTSSYFWLTLIVGGGVYYWSGHIV